jgi:two-component system sensor histidine kinase and response regulator WspE
VRQYLTDRLQELDLYDRRSAQLSNRLYLEVLRARMRPFGDGVARFPRMVRDLARSLGKQVKLEILGENTPVDRDILERLEAPLNHLLRNAVDHGCEAPESREAGKPPEAAIRLEAPQRRDVNGRGFG